MKISRLRRIAIWTVVSNGTITTPCGGCGERRGVRPVWRVEPLEQVGGLDPEEHDEVPSVVVRNGEPDSATSVLTDAAHDVVHHVVHAVQRHALDGVHVEERDGLRLSAHFGAPFS
jgi:hypothetical protein